MRFSARTLYDTPLWEAATQLAPVPVPKVKSKQQGFPGYATGTAKSQTVLRREDLLLANTDILTMRTESDTRKLLAKLCKANPVLGAAVNAYLRVGLTQDYKCWSTNMDGTTNRDMTLLAQQIVRRWDLVPNYQEEGFSQTASIRSHAESGALEILFNGAVCSELVLDQSRLPAKMVNIPVVDLKFYSDDKGTRPVQVVGGEEIDLDFPTIIYTAVDQQLKTAYASSPLEASIQPVLADTDFLNDLRRILKRAIMPRLTAMIDIEEIIDRAPATAQADPDEMNAYLNSVRSSIEATINGLQPEDALIAYSFIEFKYIDGGKNDVSEVVQAIQDMLNAKMSSGAHAMPSVIGNGSGSQNGASAEALLFMKTADGVIRRKINEHFSKILTLAVRLFGQDVSVYFEYQPIDLRPDSELEAFRTMRQSRVLELLSYGFYDDDKASIELTGQVTPQGFAPLSGTQFYAPPAGAAGGNPYSGSNDGSKSGGSATTQTVKSKTPQKAGGKSQ